MKDNNTDDLELTENSQVDSALINEGLQLIKIILPHQNLIPISREIMKDIWLLMLKNPLPDIVINLLGATIPRTSTAANKIKTLEKILNLLQKQTVGIFINYFFFFYYFY